MRLLTDDVGSFPVENKRIIEDYFNIYKKIIISESIPKEFVNEVLTSFLMKLESGLDVACYPQLYDMHEQFLKPIKEFQKEPFLIEEKQAIIPEVEILKKYSKNIYEKYGREVLLKICVTGPVDLYLREFGNFIHKDLLENIARSIRCFVKNSIINEKYLKTYTISIDEPSIGFVDLMNISNDDITDILNIVAKGFKNVQIHLHSMKVLEPILNSEIKIIGCEFASNPLNLELVKKEDLESYDKFIRAGIIRTDVDKIYAEVLKTKGTICDEDYVENLNVVKNRLKNIIKRLNDRLMFIGPDCGLRGFPNKLTAKRVLEIVSLAKREICTES